MGDWESVTVYFRNSILHAICQSDFGEQMEDDEVSLLLVNYRPFLFRERAKLTNTEEGPDWCCFRHSPAILDTRFQAEIVRVDLMCWGHGRERSAFPTRTPPPHAQRKVRWKILKDVNNPFAYVPATPTRISKERHNLRHMLMTSIQWNVRRSSTYIIFTSPYFFVIVSPALSMPISEVKPSIMMREWMSWNQGLFFGTVCRRPLTDPASLLVIWNWEWIIASA